MDTIGNSLITLETLKTSQFFVFSSPDLMLNSTYGISLDGDVDGELIDSVYYDSTYTGGDYFLNMQLVKYNNHLWKFYLRKKQ